MNYRTAPVFSVSPRLRGEIWFLVFNYTITKLPIYPIFFDLSHALAYFQLT